MYIAILLLACFSSIVLRLSCVDKNQHDQVGSSGMNARFSFRNDVVYYPWNDGVGECNGRA